MAAQDQYIQLSSLPEDVRKQVLDFIAFLMERRENKPATANESGAPLRKRRPVGLMKGQIHIADDFDAPLDDFKEYM
jgi:hypothetical protein